jgi:predicted dehydrogenase
MLRVSISAMRCLGVRVMTASLRRRLDVAADSRPIILLSERARGLDFPRANAHLHCFGDAHERTPRLMRAPGRDGRVGIALLGTGGIVRRSFVTAVRKTGDAQLVAVLSRSLERAQQVAAEFAIPEAYQDLGKLLASPNVHAVIVATPDALHESQVLEAAAAGVHILCEKPMTTTAAGCLRMKEAVARAGVTFAMGYSLRFLNSLARIREIVHANRLGPVRFARATWPSRMEAAQETWRTRPDLARYWAMSRVGTHLIDLFRWYFGEPVDVKASLVAPRDGGPNEELATVVLTFPGGLIAELTVTVLFGTGNGLEIHGESGVLVGQNVFRYAPEVSPITVNGEALRYEPNDAFADEVADFVGAVKRRHSPRAGVDDGVRNVEIMERARQSAGFGG